MIISLNDGRWAAVEVKLGSREIEEGAEHLKKLAANINTEKFPAPSFLMVLTGGEFAYRREDGVLIVPVGWTDTKKGRTFNPPPLNSICLNS